MKNTKIKLTNMKPVRVGLGIKELRKRANNMSIQQLAQNCGLTESYVNRLEEGYEPEVFTKTLEDIARATGVYGRGPTTYDELVNIFLYVGKEDQPMLI